jgi:hypothetical protein
MQPVRFVRLLSRAHRAVEHVELSRGLQLRPLSQRHPPLSRSVLGGAAFDVLPTEGAVLDSSGAILLVNEAWRRFGRENGAGSACGVGVNYLTTCERAAESGDEIAAVVRAALTAVLAAHAPEAGLDYPCHSPSEQRWFHLTVRPLAGGRRVVVLHDRLQVPPAHVAARECPPAPHA